MLRGSESWSQRLVQCSVNSVMDDRSYAEVIIHGMKLSTLLLKILTVLLHLLKKEITAVKAQISVAEKNDSFSSCGSMLVFTREQFYNFQCKTPGKIMSSRLVLVGHFFRSLIFEVCSCHVCI